MRSGLLQTTTPSQRDAAMQWVLALGEDNVSENTIAEWLEWYDADSGNKVAFDALRDFWERSGDLLSDPARMHRLRSSADQRRLRSVAAGMLARVFSGLATLPTAPRFAAVGAAIVAVAIAIGFLRLPSEPGTAGPEAASQTAFVRETLLPDGSKVELAPKSTIEVAYSTDRRLLQLGTGEAYFSVAPNKNRPFVVSIGDVAVRAVGTEFNIRSAESRVVVTVTKGTVDVYPRDSDLSAGAERDFTQPLPGGVRVSAGSEVTWAAKEKRPIVASVDPQHAAAWKQGRLEYLHEPLASVIADVNRYAQREIVIRDKELGQLNYTGTILIDATGEWLHSLPGVFPVTVATDEAHEYLEARTRHTDPSAPSRN